MNLAKSKIRSSLLLFALAIVPLAGVGAVWLSTEGRLDDRRRQLEDTVVTLARLQSAVATSKLEWQQRQPDPTKSNLSDFLPAAQDAIAGAELHGRLRSLATGVAVELNSINILPPRTVDLVEYLGLRLVARGQLADMQRFLHAIEDGTPLLLVERLALRVDSWAIKSGDPSIDGLPALQAEIEVFGAKPVGIAPNKISPGAVPPAPRLEPRTSTPVAPANAASPGATRGSKAP